MKLFFSTKQLAVDIVRCSTGDNLTVVLNSDTTEEQEEQHRRMISQQELVDARAKEKEVEVTRQDTVKDKGDRKYVLVRLWY